MRFIERDRHGLWTTGTCARLFALGVIAVMALGFLLVVLFNNIDKHMSVESCRHWAQANGRPTKIASYTYWSWDCLTPDADKPGTWISTSNPTLVGH
jgi:hypothetical protein